MESDPEIWTIIPPRYFFLNGAEMNVLLKFLFQTTLDQMGNVGDRYHDTVQWLRRGALRDATRKQRGTNCDTCYRYNH